MNKQIIALVLVLGLLSQQTLAYTCEHTTSTGTNNGWLNIDGSTCLIPTSGSCTLNTADSAGTVTGTTATPLVSNCNQCKTTDYFWKVAGTHTNGCETTSCTTGYWFDIAHTACAAACDTGYATADQGTANTPSATLSCSYCYDAYSYGNVKNTTCVADGANCDAGYSSTSTAGKAGTTAAPLPCSICATTHNWDSPSKDNCVAKGDDCVTGFTSDAAGEVATAGTTTTGADCLYCVKDTYFTSDAKTACGTSCASGFWSAEGATTGITSDCLLTSDPNSSSVITFSIVLIFSLFSLLI